MTIIPEGPKPPFDPELVPILAHFPPGNHVTPEGIEALRQAQAFTLEAALEGESFTHQERTAPGPGGPVTLSLFYPKGDNHPSGTPRPAIFQIHCGGIISGNRFTLIKEPLRWATATGAVCISVEYRLAPEHPFPAAMDDCWAGLRWVASHAAELGIDPDRLVVTGQSAGANLAGALAIRARDGKGPRLCGQLLDCGMFDDRMTTSSVNQYVSEGTWTRGSNVTAWGAILGPSAGKDGVSHLAAVSRATDLVGVAPAFVSVGSAEGFRDENVDYAKSLWAAGVQAELHVWPGGFHCFDALVPTAGVSKASFEAKAAWIKKVLLAQPDPKL
ncbi:hypothetical protein ACO1O0_007891 [Amphichorda felina]